MTCRNCNGTGTFYVAHPHAEGRYVDIPMTCECRGPISKIERQIVADIARGCICGTIENGAGDDCPLHDAPPAEPNGNGERVK